MHEGGVKREKVNITRVFSLNLKLLPIFDKTSYFTVDVQTMNPTCSFTIAN